MDTWKLEDLLDENEISNLPVIVKDKLGNGVLKFNSLNKQLYEENHELQGLLENREFKLEKEISSLRHQLQESTDCCTKLKTQITEIESNLSSVKSEWRVLQKLHDSSMLELQSSKRNNELLSQEKKNLSDQLEKRKNEVENLNNTIGDLHKQVTTANEAKFEAIALCEEAKLKESHFKHLFKRLEQEKDLLNNQTSYLNSELSKKNSEVHTLKREKSTNMLELKTLFEEKSNEVDLLHKRLDNYKNLIEEKDLKIETLANRINNLNQANSKAEEQFNLELAAQVKLIDLHKTASEENQKRVEELMRAFEEAQKLLKESSDSCEEMETQCQTIEAKYKSQLEEKSIELTHLREERKKFKEISHAYNQDTIEKKFPIAASTSRVLHSGMTLTDIYAEYNHVQEELQQQKTENMNLTHELKHIVSEIEEKTPLINQRMQEYDKLNESISCLSNQLAQAVSDSEKILTERNEAKRLCNLFGREKTRLKSQVNDLNRQVQVLLKEIEERQGNRIKDSNISTKMHEVVSSSDDVTAEKIISRHLVTFRDIEEIQLKNQQLLAALRDLGEQHEEMEKKLSSEITEKFEKDIANLTGQLDDLQKKRVVQLERIETIVRQRDMYRVLLTSQGVSKSLLGTQEGHVSILQKSLHFTSDPPVKETTKVMNQLKVEFDNYKKEKSENERLLNEQLDKLRVDVADLRIQNTKFSSQCEYSETRIKMLKSNLDAYKKECETIKEKNSQHSTIIIQHQQTVNSLRQELMIAQEKLTKCDVTIENLKSERDLLKNVESRLLNEKESAIREQQQTARMIASLQAVQNNLERMESDAKRNLEFQIEKYEKESAFMKTKLENSNEDFRAAVKVWEKQKKDLQSKIDSEIERNRKVHEELVDSYSKIHVLNQKLSNTKSPGSTSSDKVVNINSSLKSPLKTSVGNAQNNSVETKMLREQLIDSKSKLKALQDKLTLATKTAENFSVMCKELELRVAEQDEINKQLKVSLDDMSQSSSDANKNLVQNIENLEKKNAALLEENLKLLQEKHDNVSSLEKKINEYVESINHLKSQADFANQIAKQAKEDCQMQLKLVQDVQGKYERELLLHAEDVKVLSEIKEQHQQCSLEIEKLSEASKISQQTLSECKNSWSSQENIFHSENNSLQKKILDLKTCNENLYHQLELMSTQMSALQSKNWDDTPYSSIQSDLKDTRHLLQVIQFIKKEKEIANTQLDVTQSENVRLNLKINQLTRDLDSTNAELKEVSGNLQVKSASEAQHAELLKKIEMMNLLSESNILLRMEKDNLINSKKQLENELNELQEKLHPFCEQEKEMSKQIDILTAENDALRNEVKSWQSRTNQLLEQSHRIGPQEYKNMVHEIDELKSQKTRLSDELQRKQAEVSKFSTEKSSLKKDVENAQIEMKAKNQELVKANETIEGLDKTVIQIKKIGRKYKIQFDELTVLHDALVAKQNTVELSNQEINNQELQTKFEQSETMIKGLNEEIKKLKEDAEEAKKTALNIQLKANEKEEKAKKLLAQFRHKYSLLNNQREALHEANAKLTAEIDELKRASSLMTTKEEENNLYRSQSITKIQRVEQDLKVISEQRDHLQKQYDELFQKVTQQKQGVKPSVILGERIIVSAEPLTANIKPLTSPSTSGARHASHAVTVGSRPTPTASIRPMAIGTATPSTPSQARTATVLPTTATPPQLEEDIILGTTHSSLAPVPHATVQPTPATATVAPSSMSVTVSPVTPIIVSEIGPDEIQSETLGSHVTTVVGTSLATALVTPRIDITETSDATAVDSPAPTASVIVSPTITQTQVVPPTVKRPREDSPGVSENSEGSLKRIRMVSEGSQTNQQHPITSVVAPTNIAVVSAAQIVARPKTQDTALVNVGASTSSHIQLPECQHIEVKDANIVSLKVPNQPPNNDEKGQVIDWDTSDRAKVEDDFGGDEMEEEAFADVEEDVEEMQPSPVGADISETHQNDSEGLMINRTTSSEADIDGASNNQINTGSNLLSAPGEVIMAPPAFPPSGETGSSESSSAGAVSRPITASVSHLDHPSLINRQHLPPFSIPGQGPSFEEGDDSIVPSTPTLYVPRRTDGFAEAISSPQVPQVRFLFSNSENLPAQQGLSQLASQGALGVDDTRMDLSQFDEGGRTVPSTPLQVSPPSEATVPDVSTTSLEVELPISNCETKAVLSHESASTISPCIKKSEETVILEELKKEEALQSISISTIDQTEVASSSDKGYESTDNKEKVESENQNTESKDKDTSKTMALQRKPIVWKKDSKSTASDAQPTPPPPTTSASPSVSSLSSPSATTGAVSHARMRNRRARSYGRPGRRVEPWTSFTGNRRGRNTTRRGSMY